MFLGLDSTSTYYTISKITSRINPDIKITLGLSAFVSAAFISLLDNYESDTGEPEIVTPEEVAENHKFLDAIIQTSTMKVCACGNVWK